MYIFRAASVRWWIVVGRSKPGGQSTGRRRPESRWTDVDPGVRRMTYGLLRAPLEVSVVEAQGADCCSVDSAPAPQPVFEKVGMKR